MTINGTITASLVLLVLLLVSASFGWSAASGPTLENGVETYQFPGIATLGIILAAVYVLWLYQRTMTGPAPDAVRGMPDLNGREVLAIAVEEQHAAARAPRIRVHRCRLGRGRVPGTRAAARSRAR